MTHTITELRLDNTGQLLFTKYVEAVERYHLALSDESVNPSRHLMIRALVAATDLLNHIRFMDETPSYSNHCEIALSIPLPQPMEPWDRDLIKTAYQAWKGAL